MQPKRSRDACKGSPTAPSAAAGGWQFVNLSEPNQRKDKELQRLVRANAMRYVRQRTKPQPNLDNVEQLYGQSDSGSHLERSTAIIDAADVANNGVLPPGPIQSEENVSDFHENPFSQLFSNSDEALFDFADQDLRKTDSYDTVNRAKYVYTPANTRVGPWTLLGPGMGDPFSTYPVSASSDYNGYVLNHFVQFMANHCLPVLGSVRGARHPLASTWLPYAMQDATLFLATLSFATIHLDIVAKRSSTTTRALAYKAEVIKSVNERLGSSKSAVSNSTIGAVAMLTAIESISGNYKDLRIHVDALQRMVNIRGGFEALGWEGVLHSFVTSQDLLIPSMIAEPPDYELMPSCSLNRGGLPFISPIFSDLGFPPEVCTRLATVFHNMRYITRSLSWTCSTKDLQVLDKMRTVIEERLVSLATYTSKHPSEMTSVDYQLEICRVAAMVYVDYALRPFLTSSRSSTPLETFRKQLIFLLKKQNEAGARTHSKPSSIAWALFASGILALDEGAKICFASPLGQGWMEAGTEDSREADAGGSKFTLRDGTSAGTQKSLWERVWEINATYWLGYHK